ncbi:MAG: 30S ribosomal protein S1, partial [Candidatus Woesebacteria bacterium GW2011_GWD1_38_10]
QAKVDPWDAVAKKFKKDEKYKGAVTKISDYGIFVSLEEGVEGLIHITKIPPGMNLKVKDEVNVIVEDTDIKNKKISLGLVLTAKPVGYK